MSPFLLIRSNCKIVKRDQPLLKLGGVVIDRADASKADFLYQSDLLGRRLVRRVLRAGIHGEKRIRQFLRAGFNATKGKRQDDACKRVLPG